MSGGPVILAALALSCAPGPHAAQRTATQAATPSESPVPNAAALPADAIRLEQGTSPRINDRKVSVWAVYPEAGPDGTEALHIKLVVFDPATKEEVPHLLPEGGTLDVGGQTYKIVRVVAADGGQRAWGAMVPASASP